MIQLCDTSDRIQLFMNMLNGITITEVARTGTVALPMCKESE